MLEVLYLSTPQRKHPSPEIKKNLDVVERGGGGDRCYTSMSNFRFEKRIFQYSEIGPLLKEENVFQKLHRNSLLLFFFIGIFQWPKKPQLL